MDAASDHETVVCQWQLLARGGRRVKYDVSLLIAFNSIVNSERPGSLMRHNNLDDAFALRVHCNTTNIFKFAHFKVFASQIAF